MKLRVRISLVILGLMLLGLIFFGAAYYTLEHSAELARIQRRAGAQDTEEQGGGLHETWNSAFASDRAQRARPGAVVGGPLPWSKNYNYKPGTGPVNSETRQLRSKRRHVSYGPAPLLGRQLGLVALASVWAFGPMPVWGLPNLDSKNGAERSTIPELIVVTSPWVRKPLMKAPAAIGTVNKEGIQLGRQTIGLGESLMKIPGIFLQNRFNFAQDLRISIRGFGARAAFGIRGIRILVDGVPETLPDGQSQVDNIDLGSAQRIEVIRGPVSSLYGNASGGVISVTTEEGTKRPFLQTRLAIGAFGFRKYQMKAGGQSGRMNYLLNLSRFEVDGFREHSRTENRQLNGKFRFTIDDMSTLTASINFTDSPTAEDPGGLTRLQAESDPRQARDRNVLFDAGERIRQGRLGLVFQKHFRSNRDLHASLYFTLRDFSNRLPFRSGGIVDFDRFVTGGGIKYSQAGQFAGIHNRWTLGMDIHHQHDNRRRYDNNNAQRGGLVFHQIERVSSVGPFIQTEWSLLENLELTLGARYDHVRFAVKDRFPSDGDDSGARSLDAFSPKIGLLYSPYDFLNLYGNISTSFETPTTTEFANPSGAGGLNPDIGSQTATNYEGGAKGNISRIASYELAVFTIRIKNELSPFELPQSPGRTFFRNAGRTTRNGVELGLKLHLTEGLAVSGNYTYSEFFFEAFETSEGTFNGNQTPGIPKSQAHGEVAYSHHSGFYGIWDILFVDGFFADNANTARSDGHTVLNLRLGYAGRFANWKFSPFVGLNNLSNARYIANVRINAFANRFFEPAPGFNTYGGFSLSYSY